MRKIYLSFLGIVIILITAGSSSAQITIGSSDLPNTGDVIRISNGQAFPGMNAALTGPDYTWDYSQLAPTSQTVDTFVSVLSTGLYAFQFYTNSSFALKSNTPTVSLFGVLSIDYEYDFFKKSPSAYVQTGFGASMNTFPLSVPFEPKDTIYRFPLEYNNASTSSSAFFVSIPGLGYYGGKKIRTDTVDGWGTLTTPYGTFPVLRVKSVIHEIDSIHSDTLHVGFSFARPVLTEYKWLGNNQRIPLLQINSSAGVATQIHYRDSLRINPLAVLPVEQPDLQFNIYPNPTGDMMMIDYYLSKESEISVDIFNGLGEKISSDSFGKKVPGNQFLMINLEEKNISPGIYFVSMNVDGRSFKSQLIVKK